jgi:uncharacterized protein YndB with AHSA1/START domain
MGARYRFRSRWEFNASPADVYRALYDLVRYPSWWPEFRQVDRIDDGHHRMVVRAFLPYEIAYLLTREIADASRGVLQGRVDGDIEGRIRWDITPTASGCTVYFAQKVETRSDLLNLLAPIARLAFEANHQIMMRDGFVGLKAYLAGTTAKAPAPSPPQPGATPAQPPSG